MHSPSAIHLPEVLHLIALHLVEPKDLLKCRLVCRLRETLFTPYIARTVNDRSKPWSHTSRYHNRAKREIIFAGADIKNAVRAVFIQEHKDRVRHLTLYDHWLLVTTLRIPLTQLTSLRIQGHFTQPSGRRYPMNTSTSPRVSSLSPLFGFLALFRSIALGHAGRLSSTTRI
ncbi:MAG: hypothetical protein JOS17DRAFT_13782 [Linnemannia elongata]|nr:MAG: hypothetical protein JOS17DRAFT_13782 [Linnemannia elongata]